MTPLAGEGEQASVALLSPLPPRRIDAAEIREAASRWLPADRYIEVRVPAR